MENTVIAARTSNNLDVCTRYIQGRMSICFVSLMHLDGRHIMDITDIQ